MARAVEAAAPAATAQQQQQQEEQEQGVEKKNSHEGLKERFYNPPAHMHARHIGCTGVEVKTSLTHPRPRLPCKLHELHVRRGRTKQKGAEERGLGRRRRAFFLIYLRLLLGISSPSRKQLARIDKEKGRKGERKREREKEEFPFPRVVPSCRERKREERSEGAVLTIFSSPLKDLGVWGGSPMLAKGWTIDVHAPMLSTYGERLIKPMAGPKPPLSQEWPICDLELDNEISMPGYAGPHKLCLLTGTCAVIASFPPLKACLGDWRYVPFGLRRDLAYTLPFGAVSVMVGVYHALPYRPR
ncbi:hypothetical protein Taro_026272 [Colocasia esculenta]|uniref:Uncharacterized protein n=1 Tax=Colocasia esculenta TaxID=4460 RepID=A0A843VK44_COLES|nr:hypothetical protein [Colocasia esculenta]